MTVAKIGTRLGGYLAFKHYQGNTNVTNPGRAACASHTGGGAVRAMSSLLMRVQEFRIWGYIKASTPCALCSRLTVWKSRSVERKTLSQTCSSCFGVRTTRCPHPTPEGTDQCPDILELLIGDGEDRECCSLISLPSSPPSLSSQFWFAEVFVWRYNGCVKHINCDLSIQRPRSLQDSAKATLEKHRSRHGMEWYFCQVWRAVLKWWSPQEQTTGSRFCALCLFVSLCLCFLDHLSIAQVHTVHKGTWEGSAWKAPLGSRVFEEF